MNDHPCGRCSGVGTEWVRCGDCDGKGCERCVLGYRAMICSLCTGTGKH